MTTRLILGALTLSASTLAQVAHAQVAHAQSAAKPALATRTAQRETETGSWRAGDAMVWVRVAPTGAISVYASHGYRSAFAHAIVISPEDAEKWADIGDRLLAGQTTNSGPVVLADSDLALETTRAGDSVVLAVRLGGVRPDGITFLMNGQSLREVTPMLRATAKTSRAMQAANAAPPASAPAPAIAAPATTAPTAAPVAAPTPAPAPAAQTTTPATPTSPPPEPHMAAVDSPPPAPVVVATAPSAPVAAITPVVAIAPPEVAAPDTPAPAPEAEVAPLAAAAPVATVTATATPTVAATKISKVTKAKPAPQSPETASLRRTSAGSIAKPASTPVKPDETIDATKLAGSTVANLVKQWQSQLDLCYTEYGLKVNPALTGSIAVRLAIRPSGDVGAASFTRHKWSGAGSTEAESCMRARVMAWMFPPASTPSVHVFTVAFAP